MHTLLEQSCARIRSAVSFMIWNFESFVDRVLRLGFFPHRKIAADAVKAVVGTFLSQLTADDALEISVYLPEPLRDWELHAHKSGPVTLSTAELIENISSQFALKPHATRVLVYAVLEAVREHLETAGASIRGRVADNLARLSSEPMWGGAEARPARR